MYASKFGPVMEEMLTIRHRSGLQLKFIGFSLTTLMLSVPESIQKPPCLQRRLPKHGFTAPILHPGTTWRGGS